MKTAISIPDEVFRKGERLAKRRKISRSELYAIALAELLAAEPKDDLTRAYDSAFSETEKDSFLAEAAHRMLAAVTWSDE